MDLTLLLILCLPVVGLYCILQSTTSVFTVVICFMLLRLYCRLTCGMCDCDVDMSGKTVLITGASAGIGKATAEELARRNARVIMACRNTEKAKRVAEEIKLATGNHNVEVKRLELASFESVRNCALDVYRTEEKLDVLINNAGIGTTKVELTKDGIEQTMQVNHLGHFLLTMLLMDLLKRGSPSRIINVSSLLYFIGLLDVKDMVGVKESLRTLHINNLYNRTKLANILFTRELASRLAGTGITVNALHPGVVRTSIADGKYHPVALILKFLILTVGKTAQEGAQTSVYLAVHPEVEKVSGKFFMDCRKTQVRGKASNDQLAKDLFGASEEAVRTYLTDLK